RRVLLPRDPFPLPGRDGDACAVRSEGTTVEEVTVSIDALSYGVFGVARTKNGVVFVPGTAPGDVARVRIVENKRDYREAELVEIDECLIADEAVNRHLAVAREWLRGVSTTIRRLEIASARDGRVAFVANAEGPFPHDDVYHEGFLRGHSTVSGIVLFGSGWRR